MIVDVQRSATGVYVAKFRSSSIAVIEESRPYFIHEVQILFYKTRYLVVLI